MVDVLLGLQWGDEGKGKIADFLTPNYDVVARFQGGPNAGHSLEMNGVKHVLNTLPSGIFHENCINIIGNGVVIDPVRFMEEIDRTEEAGGFVKKNLRISHKAHLILPTHKVLDAASEAAKGKKKIGSTLRGIGPTYRDKIGRGGLRAGEIFSADFNAKYEQSKERSLALIEHFGYDDFDLDALDREFFTAIDRMREYQFVNSEYLVNRYIKEGKKILAEGAQGSMLDIDFGSYPFVTSSNTTVGGVCTGLGIAPQHINDVIGIFKAYCTRVGSGPFPTELLDEVGQELRDKGHEYGATTGRPRRCGWIDLVALKYAIMLSGVNKLCMMKGDVLSGFEEIQAGVAYDNNGTRVEEVGFEYSNDLNAHFLPQKGWSQDITAITTYEGLPSEVKSYIDFLEKELETSINVISVGPGRTQTITR